MKRSTKLTLLMLVAHTFNVYWCWRVMTNPSSEWSRAINEVIYMTLACWLAYQLGQMRGMLEGARRAHEVFLAALRDTSKKLIDSLKKKDPGCGCENCAVHG